MLGLLREQRGIYITSKTRHAERWRSLRSDGVPIISTWIDEAGVGEVLDWRDLWRRCISEIASSSTLIVYIEPGDVLKGTLVEVGAALANNVPVLVVGDPVEQGSWWQAEGVRVVRNWTELISMAEVNCNEEGILLSDIISFPGT